jgi:hypothetical protein
LKAGPWVRRARFVIFSPDPRHHRRSQAEIPLIDMSEFGQPPLRTQTACCSEQINDLLFAIDVRS